MRDLIDVDVEYRGLHRFSRASGDRLLCTLYKDYIGTLDPELI